MVGMGTGHVTTGIHMHTDGKPRTHLLVVTDTGGSRWAMADTIDGKLALWDEADAQAAAVALRRDPQYAGAQVVEVFSNLADDGVSLLPALQGNH